MRLTIAAILIAAAGPVWAETCPPAPDHTDAVAALSAAANAATTEAEGREITQQMWRYWADAPDARAQGMLDRGMAARAVYDYPAALAELNALVAYCPDYAEGYNQRAFVRFLMSDFGTAVGDLERAIEMSPGHVAAISGLGLTLMALGRTEAAQAQLRRAIALNPWIPERAYLIKRPPPAGREL